MSSEHLFHRMRGAEAGREIHVWWFWLEEEEGKWDSSCLAGWLIYIHRQFWLPFPTMPRNRGGGGAINSRLNHGSRRSITLHASARAPPLFKWAIPWLGGKCRRTGPDPDQSTSADPPNYVDENYNINAIFNEYRILRVQYHLHIMGMSVKNSLKSPLFL